MSDDMFEGLINQIRKNGYNILDVSCSGGGRLNQTDVIRCMREVIKLPEDMIAKFVGIYEQWGVPIE